MISAFRVNSSVNFVLGQGFKGFDVKPLSERHEFSGQFNYFLRNDTSPEGSARGHLSTSIEGYVFNNVFLDFFKGDDSFDLHSFFS